MTPDDPKRHQHTPAEERKIREAALDETLEGSFPDDHDAVKPDTLKKQST